MYVALPIVLRALEVRRVSRLTPSMVRVTLGGRQLGAFRSAGYDLTPFATLSPDDHVKLFLADPTTGDLVLPTQDDGHLDWPDDPAPTHRDYTVRRFDPRAGGDGELDIDFALHDGGIAGAWAEAATVGETLHLAGPRGARLVDDDADWWVLVADETGLPAIGRFLAEYAGRRPIDAVVVVDGPDDEVDEVAGVHWVHRDRPGGRPAGGDAELLAGAVRDLPRRAGRGWGWAGAEDGVVRALRRVLHDDLGLARPHIHATGYWRRGETIEDQMQAAATARALSDLLTPQAIRAAVTLGVIDAIADGRDTVAAIATATDTHAPGLAHLLTYLVDKEVLAAPAAGRFALTSVSRLMVAGEMLGSLLDLDGAAGHIDRSWAGLADAVRTGRPGFDVVFGDPFWEVVHRTGELAASFDEYLAAEVEHWAQGVAEHLRRVGARRVADVGGGNGTLLAALLAADPAATGVVVELERSAAAATALLAERGLADRGRGVAGNFLDAVPAGYDAYVLAQVLHDWPDEAAAIILGHCAAAAGPAGRVLVVERISDDGGHAAMNLKMFNLFGAKERSRAEFDALAAGAGLHVIDDAPVSDHLRLLDLAPLPG